jgi:hypothetical protein
MGVFISFGEHIHNVNIDNAINLNTMESFKCIHDRLQKSDKLLIFLSKASHRIKKKAEQLACDSAISIINKFQK